MGNSFSLNLISEQSFMASILMNIEVGLD